MQHNFKVGDFVEPCEDYCKGTLFRSNRGPFEVKDLDSMGNIYLNVPGDNTPDAPWSHEKFLLSKKGYVKQFIKQCLK